MTQFTLPATFTGLRRVDFSVVGTDDVLGLPLTAGVIDNVAYTTIDLAA